MKFFEVVERTIELLRQKERITYRALKREFGLDDEALDDLIAELIDAQRVAVDENGKVLVWAGAASIQRSTFQVPRLPQPPIPNTQHLAERRQLTVMFIDLVGSTALSAQLDPEEYREVIQAYRETCATVIRRFDGYLAKYIGDGLLVYFGYPTAHEDDAQRAVLVGLGIVEALPHVAFPHVRLSRPLQVRIGVHTGLVVAGEMGVGDQPEPLGIVGETPNVAARIQGLAEPNTVMISAATQRLVQDTFECQPFGSHLVKGIEAPIAVYHVQSERQQISSLAGRGTLTPLVGRDQEVGLLIDRWEQVKEGRGQVVLLSGEPGIGKSRLAYTLREHVTAEGSLLFELRCSPYAQHSAFFPLIEGMQRTLLWTRQDTDAEKAAKLERTLALYDLQETLPLFTAFLSLPTPPQSPPLTLTPQKQKERTLQALLQLLMAQAERQATVVVWEDLHWADPSSLEFLSLLVEQLPTTKLLLMLTFRPKFLPPWPSRSHLLHLVLNRLGHKQVEAMIEKAAAGHELPAEVIEQIRVKTDGVPLFVEELTKSVVENVGARHTAPLQTIPTTLQEALMARLDRLSFARPVAQLGATLGREFSYELLHAVSPVNETDLQAALIKLVEAEILYQRGVGEYVRYFFKHALIQDTAYQSLLKSTRRQYHTQIAQVLVECFPDIKANQPELLAHHYTEANLIEQAIPYWQQAGQKAIERSAYVEAISHLTKGLEILKTLLNTSDHLQEELMLQIALGFALTATRGWAASEVEKAAMRARELCQKLGEPPQIFPVLFRLVEFYLNRGELQTLHELTKQLMRLTQSIQDAYPRSVAYLALGAALTWLGELPSARRHVEQAMTLYDSYQHSSSTSPMTNPRIERFTPETSPWLSYRWASNTADPRIECLAYATWLLWPLGYPDQALKRSQELLILAEGLSQPLARTYALAVTAWCHQLRREMEAARERAEGVLTLSTEQGFPYFLAWGTMLQGGALAEQGETGEGITQIQQGLAVYHATGAEIARPYWLALLAKAYGKAGQVKEGLTVLTEALTVVHKTGERITEAELYRLKGELTLQQENQKAKVETNSQAEAEEYFLKAIEVARKQQAKSWELRASTSLARLWRQQGKKAEAYELLSNVYNWFTEGFDTKDLQEAKALLEELSHE